jgi:hypothetical protein
MVMYKIHMNIFLSFSEKRFKIIILKNVLWIPNFLIFQKVRLKKSYIDIVLKQGDQKIGKNLPNFLKLAKNSCQAK